MSCFPVSCASQHKFISRYPNVVQPHDLRSDRSSSCVPFPARKASPFVACDPAFWRLFQAAGPKLRVLAQDQTEHGSSFHEAGVWSEQTQSLFFTSNRRVDERGEAYTTLSRMDLSKRARAGSKLLQWQELDQDGYPFPTPNGGTILPNGNILLCDQGRGDDQLSSLVVVDPTGKRRPRPVLNNHQLLPFNSLNDVVVVPPLCSASNGSHESSYQCSGYKEDEEDDAASLGLSKGYVILFTDPSYGYEQHFKPAPRLPNQVYGFDPHTGEVKVLAEGFDKPNGIVVDEKRKRCYITDTGYIRGDGSTCGTRPGTIHVFDIEPRSDKGFPFELVNKRLFASVDCGAPDGIKLDTEGNVYAGCFDGVHVWSPNGTLLGKILLSDETGGQAGCANLCFIPGGLVCMAESRLFLVEGLDVHGALLT